MATLPDKPSAKHFREPLLQVLGGLTSWQALEPVGHKAARDGICANLGINEDSYGVQESTKKKWVLQWIGWAFRNMKKDGLTTSPKRGIWSLTSAGIEEALKLNSGLDEPLPDAPVPAPAPKKSKQPERKVEFNQTEEGVSVEIGPGNEQAAFHPDPYIRHLVIENTGCKVGSFSPRSSICKRCEIQATCLNATAAQLSLLAGEVEAEEREAVRAALRASEPDPSLADLAKEVNEAEQTTPSAPPGGWDNQGAEKIEASVDTYCYRCGNEITKGEECWWAPPTPQGENGVFHTNCW